MKINVFLGCARVLLWLVIAPPVLLEAQKYKFDSYQEAQGLNSVTVQSLAFDKQQLLWVATDNGVFRFLGSHFDSYGPEQGLMERDVQEVYVDHEGRIWARSHESLYLLLGQRFHKINTSLLWLPRGHAMQELTPNRMLVIDDGDLREFDLDPSGNLSSTKLYFSKAQIKANPGLTNLTGLTMTANGTLWLGCGSSLCSLRGAIAENLKVWGPNLGVRTATWLSMHFDSKGSLWASSTKALIELAPGATGFLDRSPATLDTDRLFYWAPIVEDRQGRILAGSAKGISRWDGVSWKVIAAANGLEINRISSLTLDSNGDPWIGSIATGLTHWTGYEHWEGWTEVQGLPSEGIWSLDAHPSARVLIGTINGPARLDLSQNKVTTMPGNQPWKFGQVGGIAEDAQLNLWTATFRGSLVRVDPGMHHAVQVADLATFIRHIHLSIDGRLWIVSEHGIDVVDDPTATKPLVRHVAEADTLLGKNHSISSITSGVTGTAADRSPALWFLSQGGVLRLANGAWSLLKISGLDPDHVDMKEIASSPDGTLWISGEVDHQRQAIWHLHVSGNHLEANTLPLPSDLTALIPESVLADHRGWLWVGTDRGLWGWNGSKWRCFNQQSGLIWNDTNRGVLSEAPDGSIWLGTPVGVAHLLHPETAFDPVLLSVQLISVDRGNKRMSPTDTEPLPWAREPVQFSFASPTTLNRSRLIFSYRLADVSLDWTTTQDGQVMFSGLSPGEHRFEVFASNPDVSANSPVSATTFFILAPWWRTYWFYAVCAIWALAFLWAIFRLRTLQLLRNQRKLEVVVQQRTAELERSHELLRVQATYDTLTGLLNRKVILECLEQEVDRSRQEGTLMAVLIADVDHFKIFNDTHGHLAGDAVLRRFAENLKSGIRTYDHAGRYGGEEFLVILSNVAEESLGERLRALHCATSNRQLLFEGKNLTVTCSIGVAIFFPDDVQPSLTQLITIADDALYEAKRSGRDRTVLGKTTRTLRIVGTTSQNGLAVHSLTGHEVAAGLIQ